MPVTNLGERELVEDHFRDLCDAGTASTYLLNQNRSALERTPFWQLLALHYATDTAAMAASTAQKRDSSERTSLMFPHSTHDNDRDSHQGGPSSNYGTVNDAEAALPTDRSEEQRQSSSLVTKVVGALFIGTMPSTTVFESN